MQIYSPFQVLLTYFRHFPLKCESTDPSSWETMKYFISGNLPQKGVHKTAQKFLKLFNSHGKFLFGVIRPRDEPAHGPGILFCPLLYMLFR
jgi:hypothetical protein